MKAILTASAAIVPMAAALLLIGPMRSEARDYGHAGQTFPVIEPDLLSTIEARLRGAEASGELARMNEVFAKRVEQRVRRPKRSEEHTSELQSLMRLSYAVFCLKKKNKQKQDT